MPSLRRKRFLKIPLKPLYIGEGRPKKNGPKNLIVKNVGGMKHWPHHFDGPEKSGPPLNLPRAISNIVLWRSEEAGKASSESDADPFLAKTQKSRNANRDKLQKYKSSLLNRKVSKTGTVTADLMQKGNTASSFLSVLTSSGKMSKRKVTHQPPTRKVSYGTEEVEHFSQAKKVLMFRTLSKEPLPFLELHAHFDVSKLTVRRLVKRGLLVEMWGPKAVGVRFKLSKRGLSYLKELEEAAKYESKPMRKDIIRLKHQTFL